MLQPFFKTQHVSFNHHIALPCEREAVFGRQPATSPRPITGSAERPRPELFPSRPSFLYSSGEFRLVRL